MSMIFHQFIQPLIDIHRGMSDTIHKDSELTSYHSEAVDVPIDEGVRVPLNPEASARRCNGCCVTLAIAAVVTPMILLIRQHVFSDLEYRGLGYQKITVAGSSCLDGSPAVYYKKEPPNNTFSGIVHLHGGGWCNTVLLCAKRATTPLGSSKSYPEVSNIPDSYGSSSLFNSFPTWNHYSVSYCNGGSWLHPTLGKATLENTLQMIVAKNDRILFTGCSAGGLGVVHACDWVAKRFPNTRFLCLNDASLFFGDMSKMIDYHAGDVTHTDGADIILQNDRMLTVTDIFDWDFTTSHTCRQNEDFCTADEMRSKRSRLEILKRLEDRVWWTSEGHHCRLGGLEVPKSLRSRIIQDLNVTHD